MARFELHDGSTKKFWEIELDGETLHFNMGDIGSPGRTRSKRHRHERAAQDAYEKAVRLMVAQGYEQQLDADEAEELEGPTWTRLTEDPSDLEALLVHADWLMGRDDPRGEFLAAAVAALRSGKKKDIGVVERRRRKEQIALIGDVDAFPGTFECTWGVGFLKDAQLIARDPDAPGVAAELLKHDGFALIEELTVHMPAAMKVVLSGQFPAVRKLDIRSGVLGATRASDLDLDRLSVKAPRLRDLRVRGPNAVTGSDAVTGLQHLDMTEAPGWLEAIVRARPALLTLHIASTTADGLLELRQQGLLESVQVLGIAPAWDADLGALLQVLEGLSLDELLLRDVQIDADHAATLARFGNVQRLTVEGVVSRDAHAILEGRSFGGRFEVEDVDDSEPVRPDALAMTHLERATSRSARFWSIGIDGRDHHVHYGPKGEEGRWLSTRFPSPDVAAEIAERRIEEKVRQGYAVIDPGPLTETGPDVA